MTTDLVNDQLGNFDHIQRVVIDLAIQFGPKVVVAILILIAGVFAGRWVGKATDRGLKKFNLEPPVRQLLVRIVRIFVLALFAIIALQNLGVELLPLIAGLGVAGAGRNARPGWRAGRPRGCGELSLRPQCEARLVS